MNKTTLALQITGFACATALWLMGIFTQDVVPTIIGSAIYLGNIYQWTNK